ncbi:terminase small subunit [Starkeya sp. ORNL1]|uniref:terminase small subunit n=1 Tax=Starkeya sp. ORNL1 TaxID=2709380 RepID=UPI0014635888|nr:terminase small subunit [Starkeya sp. ORNL1]QJP14814.1 terminase small subunit [Starkeya sp. ORNL1]
MTNRNLTPKRRAFIDEYLVDRNGKQAAIRAGYSPNAAEQTASVLLRNHKVSSAIEAQISERSLRTRVDADRTLTELARIGFSDVRKLFTHDGKLKKLHELDADTAGAVASVKVVTRSLGDGEVEYVHEIKMWDKNTALDKIAKHLGLLSEKLILRGQVENPLTALIMSVQGTALQPVPTHLIEHDDEDDE